MYPLWVSYSTRTTPPKLKIKYVVEVVSRHVKISSLLYFLFLKLRNPRRGIPFRLFPNNHFEHGRRPTFPWFQPLIETRGTTFPVHFPCEKKKI